MVVRGVDDSQDDLLGSDCRGVFNDCGYLNDCWVLVGLYDEHSDGLSIRWLYDEGWE